MTHAVQLGRLASTTLTTRFGRFTLHAYDAPRPPAVNGHPSLPASGPVALVLGDPAAAAASGAAPPVRVHSECLTGDVFGSWRCDCGDQLAAALAEIARRGCGVCVYLRGHEGRGIGLPAKLRAYALQDLGRDTVDANLELGYPVDARDYAPAAAVLADLGVSRLVLLSGNPDKAAQLTALGVDVVARQPLSVPRRSENGSYLQTKVDRLGHDGVDDGDGVWADLLHGRVPARVTEPAEADLVDRYGWLAAAAEITVAQLAQSADGYVACRTGDANGLSGPEDHVHLHRLRALVDAVLVGAGTVVADDPRLTTREVPGPSPVRVVLDPSGRIPPTARVLTDGAVPTLWLVAAGPAVPAPADHVEVLALPLAADGRFAEASVVALLRARGLTKLLVEGGGRTVSGFLAAGLLDRLFLTTVPRFLGDGVPALRFPGVARTADARAVPVRRFDLGADLCALYDLTDGPDRSPRR